MGKTVPIRFNDEQLSRVEEAAALAGYKHLSSYIRDRVLATDKGGRQVDMDSWAEQQQILGLLETITQEQARSRTIQAIVVYLLRQGTAQGKVNELRAHLKHLVSSEDALAALLPDLAEDIERLSGED
ncbi:hypothetical protein ACF8LF_00130 [Pseudomonas putida]|uniref:TraA n=4 Tax=Pseudomonas TaxID=286 RepID=A0A6H1QAN6_PSEAI|nr:MULTISPECIES: hypothetical protein [Pseudomonas]MCE0917712.1 hypothetical protein [Pseudomonas sp. NMI760_13]EIU1419895.1 hypothetical protein [Pseudomonas aeruginosa]EIU1421597.1 hypothetical protein [Pseudomonas aeruginosa]EKT8499350.1 hypothetical protein [Pseudomonas aeruginosa]EKT9494791.1 hypothetical protein [Pseudomonas aeruginosa]